MTTEDDFQAALDAKPRDATTRLVFADWLDERGDPRAEGYRALGVRIRSLRTGDPTLLGNPDRWRWNFLPADWAALMDPPATAFRKEEDRPDAIATITVAEWLTTRRAADDAAALAFALLPADRRAELLAGVAT